MNRTKMREFPLFHSTHRAYEYELYMYGICVHRCGAIFCRDNLIETCNALIQIPFPVTCLEDKALLCFLFCFLSTMLFALNMQEARAKTHIVLQH